MYLLQINPINSGVASRQPEGSPLAGNRVVSYPAYLLLVGPFGFWMAVVIWISYRRLSVRFATPPPVQSGWFPHLRGRYADYIDWWYLDPNAADRETGWD